MLVLSRKVGEAIVLDHQITITVIAVDGDKVRIGIDAPNEVRIFRKELLDETIDLNKKAVIAPLPKLK